jgi:anthranilate phosphoribosyltransferase
VHGADGLDELSTTGYTKISECHDGSVNTFYLHPSDVGLRKASPESLRGGGAADNARIARDILAGAEGAPRDIVLLNAGASLFISGAAASVREGLSRAADALASGHAAELLAALVRVSNVAPEAARR